MWVAPRECRRLAPSMGELPRYYYVILAASAGKHLGKSGPPPLPAPGSTTTASDAATCASIPCPLFINRWLLFCLSRFATTWSQSLTGKNFNFNISEGLTVHKRGIWRHFRSLNIFVGVTVAESPSATLSRLSEALRRKRRRGRPDRRARPRSRSSLALQLPPPAGWTTWKLLADLARRESAWAPEARSSGGGGVQAQLGVARCRLPA